MGPFEGVFSSGFAAWRDGDQRKVKIAFVIEQFDPSRGGVERNAFDVARQLANRGESVCVFTGLPPPPGVELPPGLQVLPVEVAPGSRLRRDARFEAAVRARMGRPADWDVVQGFSPTTLHTLYRVGGGTHGAYLRAMRSSWPIWKRAWERVNPKNRRRIRLERRIFAQPGLHVIANSRRTAQEVSADYGVTPERIHVIHNGVDRSVFHGGLRAHLGAGARRDWQIPPQAFVLATVGAGFARKGLRHTLAMAAALARRGVPAFTLVAGKGSVGRYARQARRLGIADRVRFLGRVPDAERVYAAADAFVLPSLYEPFGSAVLEALACGLPVVVTRCCGVSEVLEDGREGLLLDRPDAADRAADFLAELVRQPALREAFAQRAERTASELDMKHHVDRVLEVYHRVARERTVRGAS